MSLQKDKGYKKSIGFSKNKNGARKQKMFWLGNDAQKAEILCLTIISRWKELKNGGMDVWDNESLQYIKQYKDRIYEKGDYNPKVKLPLNKKYGMSPAPLSLPKSDESVIAPPSELTKPITFHKAIDKYITEINSNINFGEDWQKGLSDRLKALKEASSDILLKDLDEKINSTIIKHFLQLPKNKNTGKPISISTAKTQIVTLKRMLAYLIDEEIVESIKGMDKLFKNLKFKKRGIDTANAGFTF